MSIKRTVLTDRLRLEPIGSHHADELWTLHRDPAIAEYYVEEANWTRGDAAERAKAFDEAWATKGVSKWMAYDRQSGALVGRGGLSRWTYEGEERLEVGWALAGAFRGRGLATEIGRTALDLAFHELEAPEIMAFTEVHNERSRRVMERLGMDYLREIRWRGLVDGQPGVHDDAPFALYRIGRGDAFRA